MVKDDLCITIPSDFRCPISLDVMKSPVSLCTGVTYDRSSIQKWLDNGNNTCPATMQVLQTKEFVPNHNLHRLIQIWSDSLRQRLHSPDSSPVSDSALSSDHVLRLLKRMEDDKLRADSLSRLVSFAAQSVENRRLLCGIDGLVPVLVDLLGNVDGDVLIAQTVRLLHLIRNEIEDKERFAKTMLKSDRNCISSLLLILRKETVELKICSVNLLEHLAIDAEAKIAIAETDGLMQDLLKLMNSENDSALIESVLSCLISISMPKRIKIKLVHLGVIKSVTKLLSEPNSSSSISMTEKVLKVLETASTVREGRTEIGEDSACIAAIVQKVLKVSNTATEHSVTTLWSICYLFRDEKAAEALTKANGLTKILLLMQSNCSAPVRQMARDLLKIFRINSKSCLSSYDTKTTHIMPC
ncbi:U-box domain-containing protein 27 [Cucurbita pepo subsp. pepo]|uniref:U-box domain-containing protein 27 n=1 Tax=Cucurbita pepo subsp. pepo TaxID=3664 RepID=UPI000C9D6C67|nr:U-box domain-containing protein 27 [Cucurbita pepo subsp. pepo]